MAKKRKKRRKGLGESKCTYEVRGRDVARYSSRRRDEKHEVSTFDRARRLAQQMMVEDGASRVLVTQHCQGTKHGWFQRLLLACKRDAQGRVQCKQRPRDWHGSRGNNRWAAGYI